MGIPLNRLKMSMMAYTASAAAARALVARSTLRPVASQISAAKMDVASATVNSSQSVPLASYQGLSASFGVVPVRSFQTSSRAMDIDSAAKYIGAGAGIGSVFGSFIIGYARNPSLKQQLFSYAILGFALSEAMGLFCLMMAFLLLFAF